jgi:heat shock protein HslJ
MAPYDVRLPKWPAGALIALAGGCMQPAATLPAPPQEGYTARGQEPGWALTIANGRIDYIGNYGEKRINVARPDPRTSFNGHRYETPRLVVDITHGRCNDAMSGHGFADTVTVIADGETYRGCGGQRRPAWDN